MTNYNEGLDKILHEYEIGFVTHDKDVDEHLSKFKQAVTSLIKELVKEANPLNTDSDSIVLAQPVYAAGVRDFESNLLKMIGEE